jgi:hypothetical protein
VDMINNEIRREVQYTKSLDQPSPLQYSREVIKRNLGSRGVAYLSSGCARDNRLAIPAIMSYSMQLTRYTTAT